MRRRAQAGDAAKRQATRSEAQPSDLSPAGRSSTPERARKLPPIEIGYPVFVADGSDAFGAVRDIVPDGRPVLRVNVENAGDWEIPLDAIVKVVEKKVVVRFDMLDDRLQAAIGHTMDQEDFPPPGEEVDLVPASDEDEDQDRRAEFFQSPTR